MRSKRLYQGRTNTATLRNWDTMEVVRLYQLRNEKGRIFYDFRIGSMTSITFTDWTGEPEDAALSPRETDPGGVRIIGHRLETDRPQLQELVDSLREYLRSSAISTEYK